MQRGIAQFALLILIGVSAVSAGLSKNGSSRILPFEVDLSNEVPRMLDLIDNTRLPEKPEYPGVGNSYGIDLDVLKSLQKEWLYEYSWQKDQSYINSFHHFTTTIEGQKIHFIHEKSSHPNAIPLILFHGWPGSFLEFLPVITNLTQGAIAPDKDPVTFNIIIPSLPGFAFSSAPPANWTADDTARIMNTLMVDVLGYSKYAVHGTDWGSAVAWSLYDRFSIHVRASHFAFLPFMPMRSANLAALNITLDALETFEVARNEEWSTTGNGYFLEQSTEPNTIGLALYDNPVGQLAWIGSKIILWSDPRQGIPPSVVTHTEILRSVSLYYLTNSFISAAFMYAQNSVGFKTNYVKANTDAPMLFSAFKYNIAFWPEAIVAQVGNLVRFKNHDSGGHFPGLDNPPALVKDLREIGNWWNGTQI
ncbi:Alpha/Beta hydrolase protein [Phaeosphaeria sp. MPI-PUGE-AT-0046c]|nr:Alpha/Beta hydrolase protein [Phaeosphaeria sp. MPI-PUGE-AT-0046c]